MLDDINKLMRQFIKWFPNSEIDVHVEIGNYKGKVSMKYWLLLRIEEDKHVDAIKICEEFENFPRLESEVQWHISKAHVYRENPDQKQEVTGNE